MTKLIKLRAYNSNLTQQGINYLNLDELVLQFNNNIMNITHMNNLKKLYLFETMVNNSGISGLNPIIFKINQFFSDISFMKRL